MSRAVVTQAGQLRPIWLTLANLTGKLQTTFFRWKCLNSDWYYIEICFKGVIYNKSALIQLITWCRASDRPLSESMLTQPLTHLYAALWGNVLTHWGRVTHICVGNLTIIGSDNGLWPGRSQAIIWTNAGILLIRPPGANFSEILTEIHTFSFTKMHLKMPSGKFRPFCLGLNVLKENRVSKVRQKSLFAHINKENNMKSTNGKSFIG